MTNSTNNYADMPNIRGAIIQKLLETETSRNVKIPLAIESGSRSWGFASPDSDYDCRFIYVHKKDWYLTVFNKSDIIEYAADKVFDVNGWDIQKVIAHIVKSNAVMFEWISSNEAYIRDEKITRILRELTEAFFNPISVSYHYLSLAAKKYKEITAADSAKLKKYFYVLRPLDNLKYIEEYSKMPHMEYFRTLGEIEIDQTIDTEINLLSELKKTVDESYIVPTNTILADYFAAEIARQEERLKTLSFSKNRDYEQADAAFRKIIEMAWDNG
ncbi:hypothetical protein FACS1894188_09100 [Clostridia bacterium]|nr:hypothetical protein FACS1894188_09100 [Clostridia bacterium]